MSDLSSIQREIEGPGAGRWALALGAERWALGRVREAS
jgi:hypothetical protein